MRYMWVAVAAILSGCQSLSGNETIPARLTLSSGQVLTGSSVQSASGGRMAVNAPGIYCTGDYNATDPGPSTPVYIKCSDGRSGTIITVANSTRSGGTGYGQLSDGTSAQLGMASDAYSYGPYSSQISPSLGGTTCTSGNYYGAVSCATGRAKTTAVRGYYRKNGTYVRPHYRS